MGGTATASARRTVEWLRLRTPLALRFWDEAFDRPVREGLDVRLRASSGRGRAVAAVFSPGGYALFSDLPGLVEWARARDDTAPATVSFVLAVSDRQGRYLPAATRIEVPVAADDEGPYLSSLKPNLNDGDPFAFFLFSSSARPTPRGLTAIRARLWNENADGPAAHALVEVRHGEDDSGSGGGPAWAGMADDEGYLTLVYPAPSIVAPSSGPFSGGDEGEDAGTNGNEAPRLRALAEQSWPVTLTVKYAGEKLDPLPGGSVPDVADIASQPEARFRPVVGEAAVASMSQTVKLDRDAVLRTWTGTAFEPALRIVPGA